jgi:PKD repeat protein
MIPFTANFDGTLSYDPDGRIVSYLWNFGDGAAAEGPQTAHVYEEDGEYTVLLTVIDNRGISGSSSLGILALNPPPTATFSYSPQSKMGDKYIVGTLELITFNASESTDDGEIVAYDWNFGDGETAQDEVVKHGYFCAGTYKVVLIVTDDDGGKTEYVEPLNILGEQSCNGVCPGGGSCR